MSGNADTIKDFLVSLGFDIDQAGANKFEAVLKGVTANVLKVGAVVEGAALSIVGFTTQIANGLDKIYWASQRTGASVQGIKALGYAASQTGASAESAMSSLEGLAGFMRSNPGAEGFLNRLGVQTRDASGKMRDTAAIFTGVGQKLNNMPYYRAKQYAQMLGIDENTLMAMRRGLGDFNAQYSAMAKAIGFNADAAAKSSNRFMTSIREFGLMAGLARDKIGSSLTDGLAGSIDRLRKQILDNFPKIEKVVTAVVKGILWLGDVVGRVVYRLIQAAGDISDWWGHLDSDSKKLLETLGAIVVAWRLLNSAMWASPVTWVLGLAAALLLLYDDYKTWKEGGKSLIDWSKWEGPINNAKDAIKWIRDKLLGLKDAAGGWQNVMEGVALYIGGAWLAKVLGAFSKIAKIPGPPWLTALMAYGAYAVNDRENIKDSAQSSWNYTKRNVGDALRWFGFDTDFGRQPGTVKGANVQPDIPGAVAPQQNEPEQHAQSVKNPQLDTLNKTQADARLEAAKARSESNTARGNANTLLGRILTGIDRLHNALSPPAVEGNIGEQAPYLMRGQPQGTPPVKVPQPTKEGAALLGWMRPALANLERLYNLPAGLLRSVALAESGGDQFATSKAGAQGMFQFMPDTAKDMGLKGNDAFDPMKSADAAARYLSQLLRRSGGDLSKALASYNWGMGNVEKYGMNLLPKETREYIPRVQSNMPQSSSPTINQETTINIHGVTDPREAGNIVAGKQQGIMSNGIQQLTTGPR
ncbi:TPA: transglycosylase SLT domain-containing protein [Enterobacter roggenkampii]